MKVIPAIDIMNGEVVRLFRGDPRSMKSYRNLGDPLSIARKFEAQGAEIIQIVDLDAALRLGDNTKVIMDVVESLKTLIQVGGGIRSLDAAKAFLNFGVDRIIIGSLAFRKQRVLKSLLEEYGEDRVIVALDHLNDSTMVDGWTTSTKITLGNAMSAFSRIGVKLFLVTSVSRDGTMAGPDLEMLGKFCLGNAGVIAAGGIRNVEDVMALKPFSLYGVVVGKALYDGKIDLEEAINVSGK
jgi:phosphoribosylformimino-5-aminoimidazole carboxamide ribotide isomerase